MLNAQTYIDDFTGYINFALIMEGELSVEDVEDMAVTYDKISVSDEGIDRLIVFTLTDMIVAATNEDTEKVVKCAKCIHEALRDCGLIK